MRLPLLFDSNLHSDSPGFVIGRDAYSKVMAIRLNRRLGWRIPDASVAGAVHILAAIGSSQRACTSRRESFSRLRVPACGPGV
jgi:hypothetical protein